MHFVILPFTLLAYYLITCLLVARRPRAGTIVPQYTPPGNMTPAEMRFLRVGMTDQKSVAAVVAHLASRGLISVQPDGSDRLNDPHWTPTLKIDYLAYAIALDLKQAWGDHLVSAMFNTVATGQ